jgi:pentatricopeptide repeat protein
LNACTTGKLREAQDFLDEMAEKGFKPPCRGRDLLLNGLVGAGYLESAKSIVLRMTKEGIMPDVATFNSVLEALCRYVNCLSFLSDMYISKEKYLMRAPFVGMGMRSSVQHCFMIPVTGGCPLIYPRTKSLFLH